MSTYAENAANVNKSCALYKYVPGTDTEVGSLRNRLFLLALQWWARFTLRNVCDSATEIPYR